MHSIAAWVIENPSARWRLQRSLEKIDVRQRLVEGNRFSPHIERNTAEKILVPILLHYFLLKFVLIVRTHIDLVCSGGNSGMSADCVSSQRRMNRD